MVVCLLTPMSGARASDTPSVSPFIAQITSLAVYVQAAPLCGTRSLRWSHDLFDAIVGIVEQTRDGDATHLPTPADISKAMGDVTHAHRTGEMLVRLKSSSCQNVRSSAGLVRADALVRRHRDKRLTGLGREVKL